MKRRHSNEFIREVVESSLTMKEAAARLEVTPGGLRHMIDRVIREENRILNLKNPTELSGSHTRPIP